MSAELMGDVWENSPAKGAELLVLLAIAYFADDEGFATETAITLAGKARMSTDSVYRAVPRLEEKGLLKVIQAGEGRTPSRYQVPRSGRNLRQQNSIFDLRCRNLRQQGEASCCRNLRPQDDESASLPQSAATSEDASDRNLRQQSASLPQSAATTDAPVVGTRAHADARVGGLVGTTTPPTHPPTAPDRAHASADAGATVVDERAVEFMASLDLKRTPRNGEQTEIAELFHAKISAGFTVAEIRNSIGPDWGDARDRVRVLISRLKEMPAQPLRRPRPAPRPTLPPPDPAEIRPPREHAGFQAARAAKLASAGHRGAQPDTTEADAAYRAARLVVDHSPPAARANALAQAATRIAQSGGTPDTRSQVVLAAEILGELRRMSTEGEN